MNDGISRCSSSNLKQWRAADGKSGSSSNLHLTRCLKEIHSKIHCRLENSTVNQFFLRTYNYTDTILHINLIFVTIFIHLSILVY